MREAHLDDMGAHHEDHRPPPAMSLGHPFGHSRQVSAVAGRDLGIQGEHLRYGHVVDALGQGVEFETAAVEDGIRHDYGSCKMRESGIRESGSR
jgi:hypothetical protein